MKKNEKVEAMIQLAIIFVLSGILAGFTGIDKKGRENREFTNVQVEDAYVCNKTDGSTWTIGTKSVEMTYELKDSLLKLISFRNKFSSSSAEYIPKGSFISPFSIGTNKWILKDISATRALYGGQPVVQLKIELKQGYLGVGFHVISFPGTSVIRQWILKSMVI